MGKMKNGRNRGRKKWRKRLRKIREKKYKEGHGHRYGKSLKENNEKYRVKITMGENGKRKSRILKLNEKVLSHMTIDYRKPHS